MTTVTTVEELKRLLSELPPDCILSVEMEVIPDGRSVKSGKVSAETG